MDRVAEIKEAVESAKAQAALEAAINSLTGEVKRLTITVDENNRRLERVSVLEANHDTQSNALGRAFDEIEELRKDVEGEISEIRREVGAARSENATEHKGYDRYIWVCIGFASAISIMWSILGYRLNQALDQHQSTIARMEAYMDANVGKK